MKIGRPDLMSRGLPIFFVFICMGCVFYLQIDCLSMPLKSPFRDTECAFRDMERTFSVTERTFKDLERNFYIVIQTVTVYIGL